MEELAKACSSVMSAAQESAAKLGSLASSLEKSKSIESASSPSPSAVVSSVDHSRLLIARPPRHSVSLWTCSKVGAVCFVAGVVIGYTLKRRVRRWASKLLRWLKDD